MNIQQIKQSLDIVTVAKIYGELQKTGQNFKYKHDKSIVINPTKQIFSNFNGDIIGGSVLDLVIYMEKLDLANGIKRLKELSSSTNYTIFNKINFKNENKKAKIDFKKLEYFAKKELEAVKNRRFTIENNKDLILLDTGFHQLFETDRLLITFEKQLKYLFNNFLGWNNFFQSPSIILRDNNNNIVDIIAYRPNKPTSYNSWDNPKYIYKNSHNRGNNFLYPFKKEFEAILKKNNYLIVGEGLKNGLNALLYSVPYITLESSSNGLNDTLKAYIRDFYNLGYNIICMFDGDNAGKQSYQKFIQEMGHNFKNFLDFNSGLDFVNYLQSP